MWFKKRPGKLRVWRIIAILALLCTAVWWRFGKSHEPSWQGESFSDWLTKVPTLPEKDDPAVEAIRHMGPPALPPLVVAMQTEPSPLEKFLEKLDWFLPPFINPPRNRRRKAWEIQEEAKSVLILLGPNAREAIPAVLSCLEKSDKQIRKNAIEVLASIGDGRNELVEPLVRLLGDPECQYEASLALAHLSQVNSNVVTALARAPLQGTVRDEFWAATLGLIGPAAKPALPTLIKALASTNFGTQVEAAKAVGVIGPEAAAAVPALIKNLGLPDEWSRKCAAIALGRIGPSAREAIPALTQALRKDDYNSIDIARSLWAIDREQFRLILPVIENELATPVDPLNVKSARLTAFDLAGEIGPPASKCASYLKAELTESNHSVCFNAAYALARISPEEVSNCLEVLDKLALVETYVQPRPAGSVPENAARLYDLTDKRAAYPGRLAAIGAIWQLAPERRAELKPILIGMLKDWELMEGPRGANPDEKALLSALSELSRDDSLKEIHESIEDAIRRISGVQGERW